MKNFDRKKDMIKSKNVKILCLLLAVLSVVCFSLSIVMLNLKSAKTATLTPPTNSKVQIRVGSFNILRDTTDEQIDIIAQEIIDSGVDVLGLQEVEVYTTETNLDRLAVLSQKTGLSHYIYFKARDRLGGATGVGVLSRYPILDSNKIFLTKGEIDYVLGVALIQAPNYNFHFLTTHLEWRYDGDGPAVRAVQLKEVANVAKTFDKVILTGDFNTRDFADYDAAGFENLSMVNNAEYCVPTYDNGGTLDNIFYSTPYCKAGLPQIIKSTPSDHHLLYVDVSFQDSYKVTVENDSLHGTVSGISAGNYAYGKSFNVTIKPKSGYRIKGVYWAGNELAVSNQQEFTSTLVLSNDDAKLEVVYVDENGEIPGRERSKEIISDIRFGETYVSKSDATAENAQTVGEKILELDVDVVGIVGIHRNTATNSSTDIYTLIQNATATSTTAKYNAVFFETRSGFDGANSKEGLAIYSKYPIKYYETIELPCGKDVQKVMGRTVIEVAENTYVNVFVTDLSKSASYETVSAKQIQQIKATLSQYENFVLLGSFGRKDTASFNIVPKATVVDNAEEASWQANIMYSTTEWTFGSAERNAVFGGNGMLSSVATFITQPTYDVSRVFDADQCSVSGIVNGSYEYGTKLNVTIKAQNGFKIDSIKWGTESINVSNSSSCNVTLVVPNNDAILEITCAVVTVEETSLNKTIAWYKFNTNENLHVDATGNYNLDRNLDQGVEWFKGDGWEFNADTKAVGLYASYLEQNPFKDTLFTSLNSSNYGYASAISILYYTGANSTSTGTIFASAYDGGGVSLTHSGQTLKYTLGNGGNAYFSFTVPHNTWLRIFIEKAGNSNDVYMRVYNVSTSTATNNVQISGTTSVGGAGINLFITAPSGYTFGAGADCFCIGNNYGYENDANRVVPTAGFNGSGHKIADLRFMVGAGQTLKNNILWGDSSRRQNAELKFSYRPFNNGEITTDETGKNHLVVGNKSASADGAYWDTTFHSTIFSGDKSILRANKNYHTTSKNGTAGNNLNVDWSDYIRKGSFTISFRMYLQSGYVGTTNVPYYVISTGNNRNAFNIQVTQDNVRVYLGNGENSGISYFLNFYEVLCAGTDADGNKIHSNYWVRGHIQYSNDCFTGTIFRELDDKTYTGVLYQDNGGTFTKQNGNTYLGGSFGGYDYSFTIGGQSNFGDNLANTVYASGRTSVRLTRLDVYTGVLTTDQINSLSALDDSLEVVRHNDTVESNLIANYEFGDSTNIGCDTLGVFHLTDKGGATYDSVNGGLLLNANNSNNSATGFLYLPTISVTSIDAFDKYHGSMGISFRARLKTMDNYPYVIVGNGTEMGFYIAVRKDGFEVRSGNNTLLTFAGVLTDVPTWYRVNVSFNYTKQSVSIKVIRETEDKLIDLGVKARATTELGFGGSFTNTFTIGGIASNDGSKLFHGAYDGNYAITLSNLRVYTGVISSEEKIKIDDYDASKFYLDTANSYVNATLEDDLSLNYWLQLSNGKATSVTFNFNGHTYTSAPTLTEMNSGSGNYKWKATIKEIAPQDMNDDIIFANCNYVYQGKIREVNLNNWKWANASIQDYLMSVLESYNESTKEGKLAILTLNYGAEAQRVINHDTGNLANSLLTQTQKNYTAWGDAVVSDGGEVSRLQIKGVLKSQGNGDKAILKKAQIAPKYDNKLGWGVYVTFNQEQTDFCVQITDSSDKVLAEISNEDAIDLGDNTYLFIADSLLNFSNLEKEFRIKIFVNGEQQYYTFRYNFMATIMNLYSNSKDANLIKYIYSIYLTAKE